MPSSPEPLHCSDVEVRFGSLRAVDGANLEVAAGEILALLGQSGSGKTTLLRAIAGFERVNAGEIRTGETVVESRKVHVPAHKRSAGLVFQQFALFMQKTVAANIGYGLPRGSGARVQQLLHLGRLDGLGGRYPHQLSGGQQQRAAVLRSLAPRPKVLLLDEPFSNLDPELRAALRMDVAKMLRAEGVTAVLVTHDRGDAMSIADRIAVMDAGKIIHVSAPEGLYFQPATPTAARYGGEVQFVQGVAKGSYAETPLGRLPLSNGKLEGPVDVLVRPEWIEARAGGVKARVVERRFEGASTRVRFALADGEELEMYAPSTAAPGGDLLEVGVGIATPAYQTELRLPKPEPAITDVT